MVTARCRKINFRVETTIKFPFGIRETAQAVSDGGWVDGWARGVGSLTHHIATRHRVHRLLTSSLHSFVVVVVVVAAVVVVVVVAAVGVVVVVVVIFEQN